MTWGAAIEHANQAIDWIEARQGPLPADNFATIETTVGQVRALRETGMVSDETRTPTWDAMAFASFEDLLQALTVVPDGMVQMVGYVDVELDAVRCLTAADLAAIRENARLREAGMADDERISEIRARLEAATGQIRRLQECVALFNSMILSGESHSETSRARMRAALAAAGEGE